MVKDYTLAWRKTDEQILGFFNEFLATAYPSFSFKFNWDRYPRIAVYLERVMITSYVKNEDVRKQLPEYIHDVEDFLATGIATGLFNDEALDNVMSSLENMHNGCWVIEYLPQKLRHCYGCSIGNIVQINPTMTRHPNSPELSADEVRKMYMFHELGHKVLHVLDDYPTMHGFIDTVDDVLEKKNFAGEHNFRKPDLSNRNLVYDGFGMLEESMTQELAEFLTYSSSHKRRPNQSMKPDMGLQVVTNHDYYGIFQKPTVQFGRTLRGCSTRSSSDESVELAMIRKALRGKFAEEVIAEYYQGNADLYYDLFRTLRCMGILKNNKYATLGLADKIPTNTAAVLNAISDMCYRNTDTRDYPDSGFPPVDFNSFKTPPGSGRK